MEEKTIIKSEQANVKKVRNTMYLCGVVLCALFIITSLATGKSADLTGIILSLLVFVLPFIIIGSIYYACVSKVELTVTNKRVYGNAAFGKRVDLPIDMINAVGTSMFNGITVTTASGAIKFFMIKNKDEIHSEISKLLINRQDKPKVTTTIKQEIPQSNAEELKKYKELLDSGVISQSEFDAKKRQLLGL